MASRSTPYILELTFLGVLTLLWLVYFDNVVPMKSERVVAVEGLAIGEASHVVVTREMCFSEPSEPTAIRLYQRREEPNGIGTRDLGEEIIPSPPLIVHLNLREKPRPSGRGGIADRAPARLPCVSFLLCASMFAISLM